MTMNDCENCIHFREKMGIEGTDIKDDYCLLHGYPIEQIKKCTDFDDDGVVYHRTADTIAKS